MRHKILVTLLSMILFTVLLSGSAMAQPGTVMIYIDGKPLVSDVAPVIRLDRTMVPLRAIGEALGMAVVWDAKNYFVLLASSEANLSVPSGVVGSPQSSIRLFLDGKELATDVAPFIVKDRTMVPLRVISEGLGMDVQWNAEHYEVSICKPVLPPAETPPLPVEQPEPPVEEQQPPADTSQPPTPSLAMDMETLIMGKAQVTADQLRALLRQNNPNAPDLVDIYLSIGEKYGVRGDLAFCQAAKETGWWRFTGIVQPWQNNYCGLGATGVAATGEEDLLGADTSRIRYENGIHGAIFATPEDGVEAQIQHLYAYATRNPLPAGTTLLDPRFSKVTRGCAPRWIDLGGKWAYPGYDRNKYSSLEEAFANQDTYGHSIIKHYYAKMF